MTVKELRDALKGVDGDREVCIDLCDGTFKSVDGGVYAEGWGRFIIYREPKRDRR